VNVNFNIAAQLPHAGLNQKCGVQEIGAGFQIPFAGIKNGNRFAAGKRKRGRPIAVVKPETLQVTFGPMEPGAVGIVTFAKGRRVIMQIMNICLGERKNYVCHFLLRIISRQTFKRQRSSQKMALER